MALSLISIVYVLMMLPKLLKLPNIVIHPGVQSFIFKGANLMWPGVANIDTLGDFTADITL